MARIAYVNGRYMPLARAKVGVQDRGYQFSDGVYEVCEVRGGHLIDLAPHMQRLGRSLSELRIDWPVSEGVLPMLIREIVRRNNVRDGLVYVQVTRGEAARDHVFPAEGTKPALVITAKPTSLEAGEAKRDAGMSVITVPENRWERVDIKSVSLLPNVMARQAAKEAGAGEAWFVGADGTVHEGAATNAWIVKDGTIRTRHAEHGILRGITRATVMRVAQQLQMRVVEEGFTVEEAQNADEAFVTAASTVVMPVVAIDGVAVGRGEGKGKPGPVMRRLRDAFHEVAEQTAA